MIGKKVKIIDTDAIGEIIAVSNDFASPLYTVQIGDEKIPFFENQFVVIKLKVYWMPNPPCTPFEFAVQSPDEAKDALNILAYLDLDGQETKAQEFGQEAFRERLTTSYKAYRRHRGINGAWLIECNIGGLLTNENGEWEEWMNEDYYTIDDLMRQEND